MVLVMKAKGGFLMGGMGFGGDNKAFVVFLILILLLLSD